MLEESYTEPTDGPGLQECFSERLMVLVFMNALVKDWTFCFCIDHGRENEIQKRDA